MKKKKERKKEFRGKGGKGKGKKKSSAGFKPVRLVLLVVLSVQREGVVGRIGFTFLTSWAILFALVQPAVSPSLAAHLCWVFCLCPRELVRPAGLCAQVLGRRCRCGPWQAIRLLISQSSSFVLGTRKWRLQPLWLGRRARAAGGSSSFWVWEALRGLCAWSPQPADSAALGLSLSGGRGCPGTESRSTGVRGFGPVGGAANLCSRCSRRFQVCARSSLIACVQPGLR